MLKWELGRWEVKSENPTDLMDNVIKLLQSRTILIPELLFTNYRKLKLTELELILLIYLLNSDKIFNPKAISEYFGLELADVLEQINTLSDKGLVKIELKKNGKIREEQVNLEGLYQKMAFIAMEKDVSDNSTIFDCFEKEFGRTLSPMEYELVNSWLEDNSVEIITLALKEAVYNGVSNFRYIDKILHDWNKKGIKTEKDLIKQRKPVRKNKVVDNSFDYDWLNENSKDH